MEIETSRFIATCDNESHINPSLHFLPLAAINPSSILRQLPTVFWPTQSQQFTREQNNLCGTKSYYCITTSLPNDHGFHVSSMAPKRKAERKTGIHTLEGAQSKKSKTTPTTPRAAGLHNLTSSDAKSRAQSSKVSSRKKTHTLADMSMGRGGTRRRMSRNDEDEEYVEEGFTLDCDQEGRDDGDDIPDLSRDAKALADDAGDGSRVNDTSGNQTNTTDQTLGIRSQRKAAVRHEEATRAKSMFLDRLSHANEIPRLATIASLRRARSLRLSLTTIEGVMVSAWAIPGC